MAMALYMRMKKQSNYKANWMKDLFFQCPKIISIFSKAHFTELRRCVYLTNSGDEGNIRGGLQIMVKFIKQGGFSMEFEIGAMQHGIWRKIVPLVK